MNLTAHQIGDRAECLVSDGSLPIVQKRLMQSRTTRIERFLLIVTIVILALGGLIPSVAGFSGQYFLFGLLVVYALLNRPRVLIRTCRHPVFLASYIFLGLAFLTEFFKPLASYSEIFRIGHMIAGAIVLASLCRDRQALQAAIYSCLIAGVCLSILIFLTSSGRLYGATATDFGGATRIRAEAFVDPKFYVNDVQLYSSLGGSMFLTLQAAVIALASVLTAKSLFRHSLFLGLFLFCLVATFLPMSRGAILGISVSSATVLFAYGVKHIKTIIVALVLGAGVLTLVPSVVFSRLEFSTQSHDGQKEARARIYTGFVEHLPEYMLTGIGAGNFWERWGYYSRFGGMSLKGLRVTGPHNSFFAVTIYWGLAGLLGLIAVVYQAYRCLPKRCGLDVLSLCLLGIAVSMLMMSLISHSVSDKAFSLGLGLLVGARHWIWPQGIVPSITRTQRRFHPRAVFD